MATIENVAGTATTVKRAGSSTFSRVAKYTLVRLISLFVTIVVGVYLTILIANMGGYVDKIMRSEIEERLTIMIASDPANRNLAPDARNKLVEDKIALEVQRLGLDRPLVLRGFPYLSNALTLNLGRAMNMTSDSGSREVRRILLERLPSTLLLMGTSNLFLFFFSVFVALSLSRNYGSLLDKIVITLSPTSAAPPWFFGIFLILIFAAVLRILPFGGMVDAPPPEDFLGRAVSILKHMVLPGSALILSSLFLSIYNWRTFF